MISLPLAQPHRAPPRYWHQSNTLANVPVHADHALLTRYSPATRIDTFRIVELSASLCLAETNSDVSSDGVFDTPHTQNTLARDVAHLLGGLGDLVKELPESIEALLIGEVTELTADQQLLDLLIDTIAANVDTWLSAVRHSIPIERVEAPTAALEHARRMAQREIPVNALLRAYRLGHQHGLNLIIAELRQADMPDNQKLDLYEHITRVSFRYIDWMSEQVLQTYQSEHRHWAENRRSFRAQAIRDILDGRDIDIASTSTAIEYPLNAMHLALVVWIDQHKATNADQPTLLEHFVRQSASAAGADHIIVHTIDRLLTCAWMATPDPANSVARLRTFALTHADSPRIAVGQPQPGLHGFRHSYSQAEQARTVAMATENTSLKFVAAEDPGFKLACMLGINTAALTEWIHEVLGPLAQCTDSDQRLRVTLREFLGSGCRLKSAADALQIHANTVKYRVKRAVERRNKPIGRDRLDIEVALLMCDWFGEAVLSSPDNKDN